MCKGLRNSCKLINFQISLYYINPLNGCFAASRLLLLCDHCTSGKGVGFLWPEEKLDGNVCVLYGTIFISICMVLKVDPLTKFHSSQLKTACGINLKHCLLLPTYIFAYIPYHLTIILSFRNTLNCFE